MKHATLLLSDQTPLSYRTYGNHQLPALLLVHGAACNSTFFDETANILSQDFYVITYDRRGYGKSVPCKNNIKRTTSSDYFSRQAEDIVELLTHLNVSKVILLGCSCGSLVSMYASSTHPKLFSMTILHESPATSIQPYDEMVIKKYDQISQLLSKKNVDRALDIFLLQMMPENPSYAKPLTDEEMDLFFDDCYYFIENEFLHAFDSQLILPPKKEVQSANIILLIGNESIQTSRYNETQKISTRYQLPVIQISGSHNAARDLPEAFANDVISIIKNECH